MFWTYSSSLPCGARLLMAVGLDGMGMFVLRQGSRHAVIQLGGRAVHVSRCMPVSYLFLEYEQGFALRRVALKTLQSKKEKRERKKATTMGKCFKMDIGLKDM